MDVLARLRSDMDDAGHEAHRCGEDETVACIDILDEFIADYLVWPLEEEEALWRGVPCAGGTDWRRLPEGSIALVPRERKPSALEAMETAHRYLSYLCRAAGDPGVTAEGARDALAEAIEKEKSNA